MKKIILIFLITHCSLNIVKAQWIAQNSGTNENLYDIEFLNEKTGWAVGDAGVVIKTTDGGANWINVPNPSIQYGGLMWSIQPIDSEVVYAVAGFDFIMKTTNGGSNWDVLSGRPGSITAFHSLYFMNRDTGWFLGTNKVFRTYDGGNTLDSFYAPWFTNTDIYFKDINTGIFCGTGRMFKSTDGGENWFDTNVPVGGSFPMFDKLGVFGNSVWLGGGNPKIYKSTNLGETWFISDSSLGAVSLEFINNTTGFIGGGLNALYKTTNGGSNFYRQKTDTTSLAFISSISFVNELTGWYSCAVGKIYKTTNGGEWITNINSSLEEMTDLKYKLSQNYPNPFNPTTNIGFEIFEPGFVEIDLIDLSGKIIGYVLNENKSAGKYEITFNSRGFSSGTYFYSLKVNGKLMNVKKMIILK